MRVQVDVSVTLNPPNGTERSFTVTVEDADLKTAINEAYGLAQAALTPRRVEV